MIFREVNVIVGEFMTNKPAKGTFLAPVVFEYLAFSPLLDSLWGL
jgi:hypothetical protein